MPEQLNIPAVFMRGGTSKALVFHRKDLPSDRNAWSSFFLAALGSPDPNGRQLDGMGGGLSSLSKICIVEPSSRDDADIDYTFVQVLIDQASVDLSANCGNMSSAIGPFAVDEGLVAAPRDGQAVVRIRNTNTDKMIVSTFAVRDGSAVVDGTHRIDGVAGSGGPIRLDFVDPGGAATGRLLPTGNTLDTVVVPGLGPVQFSAIDAANPCMFIEASTIGADGTDTPDQLERSPELLQNLELIRRHGSVAMGAAADLEGAGATSIPRIAMVSRRKDARTLSGTVQCRSEIDILVRMISRGRPHRAVTVTAGLCLAVACRIPGSLPHSLLDENARQPDQDVRIGHPSGVLTVAAKVAGGSEPSAEHASVYLTARRLFQGEVLVPSSRVQFPH